MDFYAYIPGVGVTVFVGAELIPLSASPFLVWKYGYILPRPGCLTGKLGETFTELN